MRRPHRIQIQAVGAGVALACALSVQSFASAREAGTTTYLIQPGETLSGIAAATGIPVDRLVSFNGLNNPDMIVAGQVLQIAAPGSASPGSYTVKDGDTLWDISTSTGVPIDTLISVNGLANADRLSVGQVLKLPTAASPASATQRAASAGAPAPIANKPDKPSPTPAAAAGASSTKTALKPAASTATDALQQRVIAEARRVGGNNIHLGVAATNLATGQRIAVNAVDEFPSASVMKLPILLELERQVSTGALAWNDNLRAQANAMISVSDNAAADTIAGKLGLKAVNDTLGRVGLSGTHFRNLFAEPASAQNPGFNDTTPSDMAKLLELVATDQVLTPQAAADIRAMLARNNDRSKLVRLLPGDARVAHKSGWYDGVANDVGIVNVDRSGAKWVIAVFTQNVPDAETGNQVVAAVSRAVYDAWAGNG